MSDSDPSAQPAASDVSPCAGRDLGPQAQRPPTEAPACAGAHAGGKLPPGPSTSSGQAGERPPRHDEWTRAKMVAFLRELAATQSVKHAAEGVGMSRQSAYKLRNRLAETPFALAWEVALEAGLQQLAHAVMDRALNGVEQPHYYHGALVGTTRKHDNRLAIWLLDNPWKVGRQQVSREFAAEDWEALLDRIEFSANRWDPDELAADEELLSGEDEREELKDPVNRLAAESWYAQNLPRRARR